MLKKIFAFKLDKIAYYMNLTMTIVVVLFQIAQILQMTKEYIVPVFYDNIHKA